MSGQIEPRMPLLILDHNREIIAEAIECSNAFMIAPGTTPTPNPAEWDALPAKVRTCLTLPFVRNMSNLSNWTGHKPSPDPMTDNAEDGAPFAKERTC